MHLFAMFLPRNDPLPSPLFEPGFFSFPLLLSFLYRALCVRDRARYLVALTVAYPHMTSCDSSELRLRGKQLFFQPPRICQVTSEGLWNPHTLITDRERMLQHAPGGYFSSRPSHASCVLQKTSSPSRVFPLSPILIVCGVRWDFLLAAEKVANPIMGQCLIYDYIYFFLRQLFITFFRFLSVQGCCFLLGAAPIISTGNIPWSGK